MARPICLVRAGAPSEGPPRWGGPNVGANRSQARTRRSIDAVPALIFLCVFLAAAPAAHADIIRGLGRVIGGVFAIPISVLAGTMSGPPIIGTLAGAIGGTFNGVGMVLGGLLDVASSAIPLAKAAAPYVLPFLF